MKKALPQNDPVNAAILLLVFGNLAYAVASLLLRMAGTETIGTFAKAFLRNFVVLLFSAATLYQKGIRPVVKRENYTLLLSRTVLGTISVLSGYYSIDHLLLADATMLSLLGPLFTVVSSAFVLKEHTTRRQKQLLALAIVGMLLVVKPTWNFTLLFPMLMGILSAATVGYAFTLVRQLQLRGEDSGVLVF